MAMFDASCPKCRKRFGWSGGMLDKPPCPRCGHVTPRAELEAEKARMDRFAALMDLPGAAGTERCRSCGAEMLFVVTVNQKVMPVDADPSPKGNVRLREGGCQVLAGEALEQARAAGERLYLSHFASCEFAARHRKG